MCHLAHDLLAEDPRIEILTPPRMSVFSFAVPGGEAGGRRLFERLVAEGFALLSTSRVHGRFAMRFCVANHRTTEADVRATVAHLLERLE